MKNVAAAWCLTLIVPVLASAAAPVAGAAPTGLADFNKERRVIDDMEDVSDWSSGTPQETVVRSSDDLARQGGHSLVFATKVDHHAGETNYPVGWPRVRKEMKEGLGDFSGWDYFECWIYARSSRASLPRVPLSIGFYNSAGKRGMSLPLGEVRLGQWTHVVIPLASMPATEFRAVQFNISEGDYQHGDQVDFYIDDMVLTRIKAPTIVEFSPESPLVMTSDRYLTGGYRVMGSQGIDSVDVELSVGRGGTVLARIRQPLSPQREITLPLEEPLLPGDAWVGLALHSGDGKLLDQRKLPLRIIPGPF